jgi:ligand-binding sensor domain-containing protein
MGPISFRAFAQDPEKGMIYGGGTGFIAYSSDNGSSWTGIDVFVVTKKGRTTFPTCFGETQKSKANDDDTLQNLHQFCDLLVDKNGGDRVIAATDFGVFYIDDIGARIGGGKNDWVKASGLEDVVVNNLVSFGGTTFAGTASGVWASADRGSTWSDFNGGAISSGQAIYALAIDASNKEIYAGGPDGVYYSKLGGSAEWVKLGAVEGAVYSIVVDPSQSGTVFVGSETGAYVSRDFGNTFSNISGAIGGAPVYDVAVNALTSSVGVYAASANGVFSSVAQVVPMITVETPPVVEEVPPVEPAAVNAVNALQALVK